MIVRFEAATFVEGFVADSDPACLQVGVADADGGHYLLFQRAQPPGGDEDWGVYVEVDDQGCSGYGNVAACELTGDGLTVRMPEPLGVGGGRRVEGAEVRFGDERPSRAFVDRLRAVFAGREALLRIGDGCAGL